MSKNPFLNALAALGYISVVASVMFYGGRMARPEDTILGPIAVLSLFSFSAAVMGYVFFFNPFQMYFDGKKKEAIKLAFQSMGYFGLVTFILLFLLLSRLI
jgi:hypothetical protein